MIKVFALGVASAMLMSVGPVTRQQFAKYPKVEAYEVRPGLLAIPRYTADGQVCEIGMQKLLYTPKLIRVDTDLSEKELKAVIDELIPPEVRGKPVKSPADDLILGEGSNQSESMDYENVTVDIDGAVTGATKEKITVSEVVAIIKFKKTRCPE